MPEPGGAGDQGHGGNNGGDKGRSGGVVGRTRAQMPSVNTPHVGKKAIGDFNKNPGFGADKGKGGASIGVGPLSIAGNLLLAALTGGATLPSMAGGLVGRMLDRSMGNKDLVSVDLPAGRRRASLVGGVADKGAGKTGKTLAAAGKTGDAPSVAKSSQAAATPSGPRGTLLLRRGSLGSANVARATLSGRSSATLG